MNAEKVAGSTSDRIQATTVARDSRYSMDSFRPVNCPGSLGSTSSSSMPYRRQACRQPCRRKNDAGWCGEPSLPFATLFPKGVQQLLYPGRIEPYPSDATRQMLFRRLISGAILSDPEPDSPKFDHRPLPSKAWMRHAGLGIELGGTTLGCGAMGYAMDWWLGSATPYATAAGLLIGFAFAMFRFIQNVTRTSN